MRLRLNQVIGPVVDVRNLGGIQRAIGSVPDELRATKTVR
jgi:hypothetical protein